MILFCKDHDECAVVYSTSTVRHTYYSMFVVDTMYTNEVYSVKDN